MTPPSLLYVFRDGWRQRLEEVGRGDAPAESYGYFALAAQGVEVDAVDSAAVTSTAWLVASRAYQRGYTIPRSGFGYRLDQARAVGKHLGDDGERVVVATTDSIALPLLALHRRGRLRNPIVYVSIGLSDAVARGAVHPRLVRRYACLALAARVVLVFTPAERDAFAAFAPRANVRVVRLGIDSAWWSAGDSAAAVDVLAPGRDVSRSFATLATAVEGARFRTQILGRIAARQGVRPTAQLELRDDVGFAEFRRRLRSARVVAIPSQRSVYGSGQATALQAMAAGRPVVMTDTGWARHFGLSPDGHFVEVPPEDPNALRAALEWVLADTQRAEELGDRAQAAVADLFGLERQAGELLDVIA